jgi:EAL domain-containing protein (putative c-di-GMP-specific phosphodiesterase class I)
VSPDVFIRVAERSRLILALGEFALREACRATAAWLRDGTVDPTFRMSVNLSTRQLVDPDLFDRVQKVLADTGLPPESLCLEVTETALMADVTAAEATLRRFHELGAHVSIDDFGTGYSSLLYLRQFPVTVLKLDRAFVAGLGRHAEDEAIVHASIGLAHALGLQASAEGVEDPGQLAVLVEMGCDLAQGYHWSPPAPADHVTELLRSGLLA